MRSEPVLRSASTFVGTLPGRGSRAGRIGSRRWGPCLATAAILTPTGITTCPATPKY